MAHASENSSLRLRSGLRRLIFNEAVDDRRALRCRVKFADQGVAVVDQVSFFDRDDAHAFTDERLGDGIALVVNVDGSMRIDLQGPGAFRILPSRRVGVVRARAGQPAAGRGLPAERLMGADVIVLAAEGVEPLL